MCVHMCVHKMCACTYMYFLSPALIYLHSKSLASIFNLIFETIAEILLHAPQLTGQYYSVLVPKSDIWKSNLDLTFQNSVKQGVQKFAKEKVRTSCALWTKNILVNEGLKIR